MLQDRNALFERHSALQVCLLPQQSWYNKLNRIIEQQYNFYLQFKFNQKSGDKTSENTDLLRCALVFFVNLKTVGNYPQGISFLSQKPDIHESTANVFFPIKVLVKWLFRNKQVPFIFIYYFQHISTIPVVFAHSNFANLYCSTFLLFFCYVLLHSIKCSRFPKF